MATASDMFSRRHLICKLAAVSAGCFFTETRAFVSATTDASHRDWLADAGRYLYVTEPTRWSAEVESWRGNEIFDTAKIEVYIGDFPRQRDASSPKTLIKFTEEGIRKGRLILYDGDRAWMYFRGTGQAIRIPLTEQLIGDADAASILNIDLRRSYIVSKVESEVTNEKSLVLLTLNAREDNAPFDSVLLKADAETAQPIQAQFLTLSGKLAKTVDYLSFQPYQGRNALHSVRIKAFLNSKTDYTVIRYLRISTYELPRRFFNPNMLKDF